MNNFGTFCPNSGLFLCPLVHPQSILKSVKIFYNYVNTLTQKFSPGHLWPTVTARWSHTALHLFPVPWILDH